MPLTVLDVSRQETGHEDPHFLPDGKHFIYHRISRVAENSGIYVGSLDAKPEEQASKRLMTTQATATFATAPDGNVSDSSQGYLLFLRDDALVAQPFDQRRLELTGEPHTIAEQVDSNVNPEGGRAGRFSASAKGDLAFRRGTGTGNTRLAWLDRQGKPLGAVGDPAPFQVLALSPDGSRVAVLRDGGQRDLWLLEIARGASTRFTSDPANDFMPVWSPDGSQIAFSSNRKGAYDLYQKPSNSSAPEAMIFQSTEAKYAQDWSPDGHFLLYAAIGASQNYGNMNLFVLPMQGERKPVLFPAVAATQGRFSPDGHWIVYTSFESGRSEVYIQPFPASAGGGGKWTVSTGGGRQARWRRDGKEILYLSPDEKMMSVDISTSPTVKVGVPKPLFTTPLAGANTFGRTSIWQWDVTADGQKFLIISPLEEESSRPITVVLNWRAGLKK